jgi:CDP-paratose 2-epimerase
MTRPVLITGGAGFIGTNLADRLLSEGQRVLIFDNLSRAGVERNLQWLQDQHGPLLEYENGDVRDADAIRGCVRRASAIFHFAAQVAVTTSLVDPITDFEINARGTLNILEELRWSRSSAPLFFTSTNKVYGELDDVQLRRAETRYVPTDARILTRGVSEERCLCFHSPYGCSKGTADQYVLDYARSFGVRSTVFRMSCIYGPHQFGTEDQGWVAHFLIRALDRAPLTLFGDGRQVRDILFVADLVEAFMCAWHNMDAVAGRGFNIGGGSHNATSLLELLQVIAEITGEKPEVEYESWRVGDQRYYVSDTTRFTQATGWRPAVGVRDGIVALRNWLAASRGRMRVAAPVLQGGAV